MDPPIADASTVTSPIKALEKAISEARAEASWTEFAKLLLANNTEHDGSQADHEQHALPASSVADASVLSVDQLFELLDTLVHYGTQNNQTRNRISLIATHIRHRKDELLSEHYNRLLSKLGKAHLFDECDELVQDMARMSVPFTQIYFENLVCDMIAANQVDRALAFSAKFSEYGLTSRGELFSAMIRGFVQLEDLASASQTLSVKQRSGFAVVAVDYLHILNYYARKGNMQQFDLWKKRFFNSKIVINLYVTGAFIYAFGRMGLLDEARQWMDEHKKLDIERKHLAAWNGLLDALAKHSEDLNEAVDLLKEMQQFGPKPDAYSFGILMDAFVKSEDVDSATQLLQTMEQQGVMPGSAHFAILINGHVKRKDVGAALEILEQMKRMDVAFDQFTYGTLLDGYCKTDEIDSAIDIYNHVKTTGIRLNPTICTSLMFGLSRAGRFDEVFRVYEDFRTYDLKPDEYTYAALIFTHAKRGEMAQAHDMLERMKDDYGVATVYAFNALLCGYVIANDPSGAFKVLSSMKTDKISPNIGTYNILMDLASMEGRVDNILKFFHILVKDEAVTSVDSRTISHVLQLLGKHEHVDAATTTFRALMSAVNSTRRIHVDENVWTTYIEVLGNNGKFPEARQAISDMIAANITIDETNLRRILKPFNDESLWDDVDEIVRSYEQGDLKRQETDGNEKAKSPTLLKIQEILSSTSLTAQ